MIDYSDSSEFICNKLAFLKEFGFGIPEIEYDSSEMAGHNISFTFISNTVCLKLHIAYWKPQLNDTSAFVVQIENKEDRINLSHWLKQKKKKNKFDFFNDENLPEERFIQEFMSSFEHLCRGDLKDILEGRRWDEVPFDWGDYK